MQLKKYYSEESIHDTVREIHGTKQAWNLYSQSSPVHPSSVR